MNKHVQLHKMVFTFLASISGLNMTAEISETVMIIVDLIHETCDELLV